MAAGPQNPTRLARVANLPYNRLDEYLGPMASAGLVKAEPADGHERYSITPRGMDALAHLDEALKMLYPALK